MDSQDDFRSNSLLNLLEKILGKGRYTGKGNYSFKCPNGCKPNKNKLEINLETEKYQCWICGTSKTGIKGNNLTSLLKKLKVHSSLISKFSEILKTPITYHNPDKNKIIELPSDFINFKDNISNKFQLLQRTHALQFLKQRNINDLLIEKYNIGFCCNGDYSGRVIIPSYNEEGILNYFIARSYNNSYEKYKNPPINKNIIGLEYFINWDSPIILVEGIFDALTIQRNVIPLFGKNISEALMKKLVLSSTEKIYIALDEDAKKSAIHHCQTLMEYGKEIYYVDVKEGDISEMGFQNSLDILENTNPLNLNEIVKLKLNIE